MQKTHNPSIRTMTSSVLYGSLANKILGVKQYSGFDISETLYASHKELQRHTHEHPAFVYVLTGAFDERFRSQHIVCKKHDLMYRPADQSHSNKFYKSGGRCLNIVLKNSWLARFDKAPGLPQQFTLVNNLSTNMLMNNICQEFFSEDVYSPLALEGLLLELVAVVGREQVQAKKNTTWLSDVRKVLHSNFADAPTLTALAHHAKIHPVHLARAFRKEFSCSVGEYVRRLRVEYASRELVDSEKSLSEIAYAAGFFDQSHFCVVFKRLTGFSPRQFRRSFSRTKTLHLSKT